MEFLDSGQLYEEFPSASGRQVTIRICIGEPPDPAGMDFLKAMSEQITSFGVDFEYEKYNG